MSWEMEHRVLHTDPGKYDWRASAIRLRPGDDEEPWHIFISGGRHSTLHLAVGEVLTLPNTMQIEGGEDRMAKLVLVLGVPWRAVLDDPLEVIGFQARCLADLPELLEMIDPMSLDELVVFRAEMSEVDDGEFLQAGLTGDLPSARRN